MSDNIWLVQTVVRPSGIHGLGRFSVSDIKADTPVAILSGEIVPKTGEHLPINGTGYCIKCPQTFINHSASANLILQGQIVLKTSGFVAAGDELLLDYTLLTSSHLPFIELAVR